MNVDFFKLISEFPFIFDNSFYDGNILNQNKYCTEKCKKRDCVLTKSTDSYENYICHKGYNSITILFNDGKYIINGLIFNNNSKIPSGTKKVKQKYIFDENYVIGIIKKIKAIEDEVEERVKFNLQNNFALFHDVRTVYALAFATLEKHILSQVGGSFIDKLKNSGQVIVDLYDELDLVNSHLEMIDVIANPNSITKSNKSLCNLYKLIDKLVKLFNSKASKKGITIKILANKSIPDAFFYEYIKIVPLILIDNAIKYSNNNSIIDIKIDFVENNLICISIISLGEPVNEDERELIFNKYFRGSNTHKYSDRGIGMGLWIANNILKPHNSKLCYEYINNLNIFKFALPINI